MKILYCLFAVALLFSVHGCTGGSSSASGGADIKGKKINPVPPT